MANWNSRGIRVGMVLDANLKVIKVTERNGVRRIYLGVSNLPPGFEADNFSLTVQASQQDVTVAEANMEIIG